MENKIDYNEMDKREEKQRKLKEKFKKDIGLMVNLLKGQYTLRSILDREMFSPEAEKAAKQFINGDSAFELQELERYYQGL